MRAALDLLPTQKLCQAGQSPWLDYLSRDMLNSGKLKALIDHSGIMGVTSNPSIFQSAISQSKGAYDKDIEKMAKAGASTLDIYDALTVSDIQKACDLFKKIYTQTKGEHGYVSLEVLPNLAYNSDKTVAEALRLHKKVNRPNLMVKVPATEEGICAIRQLIGAGISINVTLIFSVAQYKKVAEAYIAGIQDRLNAGGKVDSIRSVASVFVSRFDTFIDKELESMTGSKNQLQGLLGKAGIANSKLVYQEFKKLFYAEKFKKLQTRGAQIQKVLWGSTSCKNTKYSDLLYVETLVGPETVNTMPQVTVDALLDHGVIKENTIEEKIEDAKKTADKLSALGFSLDKIGDKLQTNGIQLFCQAFDDLMRTLELAVLSKQRIALFKKGPQATYAFNLPSASLEKIKSRVDEFKSQNTVERFLKQDPSIWKTEEVHVKSINNRMGWLKVQDWIFGKLYEIDQLKLEIQSEGFKDIVLLGMGGSSLAPEVMSLICNRSPKSPRFCIVDTTDPCSINQILKKINLKKTLFIVSSKSGSTIETFSQYQFFYEQYRKAFGKKAAAQEIGKHWIAITDSESKLEATAKEKKFRQCFVNPSNIGGRFSALSLFGMVPAALIGVNIRALLLDAQNVFNQMTHKSSQGHLSAAVYAGLVLAHYSKEWRDKLTLVTTKSLKSFGSWLEQLIAESTGKEKLGILPVDSESLGSIAEYGDDRVFVSIRRQSDPDFATIGNQLKSFEKAGIPWIDVVWTSDQAIGGEFLSWELVTAFAAVVLKINPFDELNVTESKEITSRLLGELKKGKTLELPTRFYSIQKHVELGLILKQIKKGTYLSLLGYLDRNPKLESIFQKIRQRIKKHYKIPVLLGFGPRYLHSIGQFYKGGTPSGLFIEFVCQDTKDLPVPESHYTFSQLKQAQALGDFEAIQNKGLPIMMIDLGKDPEAGLKKFDQKLSKYLAAQK